MENVLKRLTESAKDNAVAQAFELPPSERQNILVALVNNYFEHYGIIPPIDTLLDKGLMSPLIDPNPTQEDCINALNSIGKFADEYHRENTIRIKIDKDVTKATLYKFMKRTPYGDRIDEMGIDGSTKRNLQEGYIALPVLDYILHIYDCGKYKTTLELTFGKHTDFIFKKLKELRG